MLPATLDQCFSASWTSKSCPGKVMHLYKLGWLVGASYWPQSVHIWKQSLHKGMLNDSILCHMPHCSLGQVGSIVLYEAAASTVPDLHTRERRRAGRCNIWPCPNICQELDTGWGECADPICWCIKKGRADCRRFLEKTRAFLTALHVGRIQYANCKVNRSATSDQTGAMLDVTCRSMRAIRRPRVSFVDPARLQTCVRDRCQGCCQVRHCWCILFFTKPCC